MQKSNKKPGDYYLTVYKSFLKSKFTVYQKLIFLYLKAHGKNCFPAIKTIAKDLGISTRTVMRNIQELRRAGVIIVEKRKGTSNRYILPNQLKLSTDKWSRDEPDSHKGCDLSSLRLVTEWHTKNRKLKE